MNPSKALGLQQAAETLKNPAAIVIASEAKQSRSSMKSMNGWIATPGFALLAMTDAAFFSSLLIVEAHGG